MRYLFAIVAFLALAACTPAQCPGGCAKAPAGARRVAAAPAAPRARVRLFTGRAVQRPVLFRGLFRGRGCR